MNLYVESSAIAAWLLGEPDGEKARQVLKTAKMVFTSRLTLIELERAMTVGVVLKRFNEKAALAMRKQLASVSAHWSILELSDAVLN